MASTQTDASTTSPSKFETAFQAAFTEPKYEPKKVLGKRQHDNNTNSRGRNGNGQQNKKLKQARQKAAKEGGNEEVLMLDIQNLLAASKLSGAEEDGALKVDKATLPEPGTEIEVTVKEISSTGDGIAFQEGSPQIYVVPFAITGDTVKVKVYRHLEKEGYTVADFISVVKPSPLRDDSRINCQYFARCSGCQFQMMDYENQLQHKRTIVEKAYRNFSQLPPDVVPAVQDTIGSPLQYGYRTKLTPHFDGPPGHFSSRRKGVKRYLDALPEFGFGQKASRKTLDIEDCPIGTEAVRKGLKRERNKLAKDYDTYSNGATKLLRESTQRVVKETSSGTAAAPATNIPEDAVVVETEKYTDIKTCITDSNATSTEYIDDYVFTNPAGAFFQNNNSILPVFTDYIRQHLFPPATSSGDDNPATNPIRHLIDAYSGSGLFSITLASLFPSTSTSTSSASTTSPSSTTTNTSTMTGSTGIDIADKSILFAQRNATLNNLPPSQCRFIAADANQLFQSVSAYDPNATVVILDPPRKGCDVGFLRQLLEFGPRRVVYVSCNVHTQARDVGVLCRGVAGLGGGDGEGEGEGKSIVQGSGEAVEDKMTKQGEKGARYEIESLRGFDFFPQTGHVEGVAVLNRVD